MNLIEIYKTIRRFYKYRMLDEITLIKIRIKKNNYPREKLK